VGKPKATKVPIAERLRRAFAAATSDLQPRGRLPKGMTDDQATRALLAYAGFNLERFATAGEAMHRILAEDYGDDDDDDAGDQWDDAPELRPQTTEPGSPSLPGSIPPGSATPDQIQALLADQDRETCRRFAVELLRWLAVEVTASRTRQAWERASLVELARDLEMMEHDAIGLVAKWYDAAKAPTLIKAEPEPDQADDQADDGIERDEDVQAEHDAAFTEDGGADD
jgi:hypothetical protein